MVIPIFSIVIAVVNIMKANKRIKEILKLNQTGKLIKNLPYRLEDTGTVINGVKIQRPVVEYVLPSGVNVTLYGDARYDQKTFDSDGIVESKRHHGAFNNVLMLVNLAVALKSLELMQSALLSYASWCRYFFI